jgi:hypothetical protein
MFSTLPIVLAANALRLQLAENCQDLWLTLSVGVEFSPRFLKSAEASSRQPDFNSIRIDNARGKKLPRSVQVQPFCTLGCVSCVATRQRSKGRNVRMKIRTEAHEDHEELL